MGRPRKKLNNEDFQKLENAWGPEGLPPYLTPVDRKTVKVRTEAGFLRGTDNQHSVTLEDVVTYFRGDARNMLSGLRSIGTINGDWRPIDNLVDQLWNGYFKIVNPEACEKVLATA